MRQILLSALKILISAALLYLALRKVDLSELASRINISSLGWIALAVVVSFLQLFAGALRWCQISAECGAPLTAPQAMRFNTIGTFFNQTLPSAIGGDAMRLWLVARGDLLDLRRSRHWPDCACDRHRCKPAVEL